MLTGTESDEATRAASELHAAIISTSNVEAPSPSFHPTVTSYNVQVSHRGEQWVVGKRYSEFAELNRTLISVFGAAVLPSFPPKLLLNAADDVADRYLELEAYLRGIVSDEKLRESRWFCAFLRVPTPRATSPTQLSGAPMYVYDAERGAATLGGGLQRSNTAGRRASLSRLRQPAHQGSDESYAYEPFDVSSFGGGGARPATSVDESEAVSEWIAARGAT